MKHDTGAKNDTERGEWLRKEGWGKYAIICPRCGKCYEFTTAPNFCPNCGLPMKNSDTTGGADNESR